MYFLKKTVDETTTDCLGLQAKSEKKVSNVCTATGIWKSVFNGTI